MDAKALPIKNENKRKNKSKNTWKKVKKYKAIYFMLIPVLVYFAVFSYLPLFMGFVQSFQKSKMIGSPEFVGFENYKTVLADKQFMQSITNSLVIGIGTLACAFVLSIVLAILINEIKNKTVRTSIQTITYLPNLFSWTVVGGIWISILSVNGLLNGIAELFGKDAVHYMSTSDFTYNIMIFTGTWKALGYYAVLFLASIVAINPSLFEAAQIDGASRLKQITKIIIPQLKPTMKAVIMLGIMGVLRNFDQVFVMGNSAIMDKARTPLLYIYSEGITKFNTGKATAAATIVLILTLVITFVIRKLIKYDND